MKPKNPIAVALGKLAAGKPKNYSKAERERRKKLMEKINKARRKPRKHPRKPTKRK